MLLLGAPLIAGCDEDRFLSGQFTLEVPEEGDPEPVDTAKLFGCTVYRDAEDRAVGCGKWLQLNLGHFGSAVVGTLRFYDKPHLIEQNRTACAKSQCTCQYIDAQLRNGELNFDYAGCDEDRTERPGRIRVTDSNRLEWVVLDPTGAELGTIELVRSGFPTSSAKICDLCEK